MEMLFLYLVDLLDNLSCLVIFFMIALVTFFVIMVVHGIDNSEMFADKKSYEEAYKIHKFLRKVNVILIVIIFFFCLVPSKQTLLIIGGTHLAKKTVITNERLQKVNKIIDLELNKRLNELEKGDK